MKVSLYLNNAEHLLYLLFQPCNLLLDFQTNKYTNISTVC